MLTQCYDTAQLLMISGANINERDNQGKTAFDYHKEHQTESKKKFGGKVMNFLDELFEST